MDHQPNRFGSFGELAFMMDGLTDLNVIIKSGIHQWKFSAHKLILSCASTYFSETLSNETVNEIVLENLTPSSACILFIYIYYEDFRAENWIDVKDLLEAASTYKMTNLVEKCGKFLEDAITPCNVCYIYEKALVCPLPCLQQKCLKLISDIGFKIIRSQVFGLFKEEIILNIISNPELNIDTESIIFKSLHHWAQLECCRKNLEVNESNIINEIEPFLKHICVENIPKEEDSSFPSWFFKRVKPKICSRKEFHVPESLIKYSLNLNFEIDYKYLDFIGEKLVCLRFSVNLPIYLIGVHFTFVCRKPTSLHLKLIKENNPSELLLNQISCGTKISSVEAYNNTWQTIQMILLKPIYLKPSNIYQILTIDEEFDMQATGTELLKPQIRTPVGNLNIHVYGSRIWGVTNLLFL